MPSVIWINYEAQANDCAQFWVLWNSVDEIGSGIVVASVLIFSMLSDIGCHHESDSLALR